MPAASRSTGRPEAHQPPRSPERDVFRSVVLRLAGLTALLLVVSQGAVSYLLAEAFEDVLLPEIRRKAEVAGGLAADQIGYALSLGIPLESLVEMEEFLDGVLARNPDLVYLRVSDTRDTALYSGGEGALAEHTDGGSRIVLPILVNEELAAFLSVGLHEDAIRSELAELHLDIATVLLATLLVGIELLVAFVVVRVSGPIRLADRVLALGAQGDFARRIGLRSKDEIGGFAGAYNAAVHRINAAFAELTEEAEDARAVQLDRKVQERIRNVVAALRDRFRFTTPGSEHTHAPRSPMDVRVPLFLFMLSQELSRPFLPLFFNDIYTPIAGLSRDLVIGLPITAFMTMVLVAIPIAGALSDRFPPRMMFLAGMIPSVVGHVGAAFSESVVEALFWWTLSGLGYGVIFISAQAYAAYHTESSGRAVGMSGFLGAVFAAFVCGPAIGGILADRLGYEQTLLVAAALAAFSAAAALVTIDAERKRSAVRASAGAGHSWRRLLAHRRFLVVTLFSALPAKLVLGGLFFYLVPLYLADLGNTQSNIGRVMMVYGIACVAVTPLAARRSDRLNRPRVLMVLGGLFIALGCVLPAFADATGLVLAAVAVMGVGHALATTPQLAVIQEIAEESGDELGLGPGAIVGAFRTLERIGTAAGALVTGAVVTFVGYGEAMMAVGLVVLLCTALYFIFDPRPRERPVPA